MTALALPTVVGNHISPFVRKVLAICRIKGIDVAIDPIVPFFGDDRFGAMSPLRRIPVFVHDGMVVNDSSVIAEYLEDIRPQPSILPGSAADRARSRWLEEFADTRLAQVFLWDVFGAAVVGPGIFKTPRDLDAIAKVMREDVPPVMDTLEAHAPADGFVGGESIGLGDLSVASHFANLRWSRQTIEPGRWPRTLSWVGRVEAHDALRPLNAIGDVMVRQPPAQYREVLAAAGVSLSATTYATSTPRRVATSQV